MNYYIARIKINNTPTLVILNGSGFITTSKIFKTDSLDELLTYTFIEIENKISPLKPNDFTPLPHFEFAPLLESQVILGAGVTFKWDNEKLENTPNEDVYKKIYFNERPMLFMKGFAWTVSYDHDPATLRKDSSLTIPESEAIAYFNIHGEIIGYGLGNDLTYLDFEKENPLYQMQAKLGKGSSGILPCFKIGQSLPKAEMCCSVTRNGKLLHSNSYSSEGFYRSASSLMVWVNKMNLAPYGGGLSLGCGVAYPAEFALKPDDQLELSASFLPWKLHQTCSTKS